MDLAWMIVSQYKKILRIPRSWLHRGLSPIIVYRPPFFIYLSKYYIYINYLKRYLYRQTYCSWLMNCIDCDVNMLRDDCLRGITLDVPMI